MVYYAPGSREDEAVVDKLSNRKTKIPTKTSKPKEKMKPSKNKGETGNRRQLFKKKKAAVLRKDY